MHRCVISLLVLSYVAACAKQSGPVAPATVVDGGLPGMGDPAEPLPVDPRVEVGTLDNGLTYYLEHNARPEARAELRLVLRAGSVLEDDDQRGAAHFLEHMAFNGSEHFPGTSLVSYLESIGTQFGAHLNAYTSFDETVYMLRIPTDDPEIIDQGMWVLRDWAGGLTLDPEECEKERGVVLEEWRLQQGLAQRVQDATVEDVFFGSRYLERFPIGTEESLTSMSCEALTRFYEAWYRPELMAIMVVGDLDMAEIRQTIEERFGDLENPPGAPAREYYQVGDHDVRVTVFSDPELTYTALSLLDKVDDIEGSDHAAYREFLVEGMTWGILNDRIAIASQEPDAPFLGAGAQSSAIGHQRAGHSIGISPKEGRELEALERVLLEVRRFREFGVTSAEVERARLNQYRGFQGYFDERDKTDSSEHIEELVRVFLTDEPMPGIPYEYALAQAYLGDISPEEIGEMAATMFTGESRLVQLMAPAVDGKSLPTEAEIIETLARVADQEISPPEEEGELPPLMTSVPEPGSVDETSVDEVLGITSWTLSNGMRVLVRPSDFQEDELVFEGFSPGGSSLVDDDAFISSITATGLAVSSGLGDHDLVQLSKILAGYSASVTPFISDRHEGVSGGGSATDAELLLQLIHLTFASPRFSEEAFARDVAARREGLRHRESSPDSRFWDAWSELVWQGHPRTTPWTLADVEEMRLDTAREVYAERFANAGDFTFVFGGSIDLETFRPLVEQYLGSLPSMKEREEARDTGARMVDGVHESTMQFGETPRGRVQLQFSGPFASDWVSRNRLTALRQVLEVRLRERLREDLGGTYGVSVGADSVLVPEPAYSLSVGFQCDPERLEELVEAMWQVLEEIRVTPVSTGEIESVKEKRRRERETAVRSNAFWVGSIASALMRGEDPTEILRFDERNDSLTASDVQALAADLINRERYVLMVQEP